MVNVLWFLLLASGVLYGCLTGNAAAVTEGAFQAAADGVELLLGLLGMMCLWTGMLNIAEKAGLVGKLAVFLRPLVRWLFPSVPHDHPAFSAIVMNISANLLGLGNAATPFGLQAMEHLQTLNPKKDTASPAMVTLLALNTACVTLMPVTVISLRAGAGSADPGAIIGATVCSSLTGTVFAIAADRFLRKWGRG